VSDEQVELLIFEVAGVRYGADASSVLRIDRAGETEEVGSPLGKPDKGGRALIFSDEQGGERWLRVDSIEGVRTVSQLELRRLPGVAIASPISIGAWLDADRAVLLVDLKRMATTSF
jgi:hypothetical protein